MRLVTWNLLKGKARDVWPRLQAEMAADFVFLQEADSVPQSDGVVWQRVPGLQWGRAVITTAGSIRPIVLPGYEGWVVGGEVDNGGHPLAVFSLHAPTATKTVRRRTYAAEVVMILSLIGEALRPETDLVIGGDFNITLGERHPGEALKTHSSDRKVLKAIASMGLISCWTAAHPGVPLSQTLRLTTDKAPGKTTPYHCDGILVPQHWAPGCCCDILTDECFRISDHNPVSANVNLPTTLSPQPTPPSGS
jgi:endonuclease/exonuclease/phosphatase family metal-dependent hydrolase